VDLRELGAQLGRTRWGWALVSVVIGLAGLYARAFRWRWLFPPGVKPPGVVPATMIGYMANNVLPLRAGELVRIYTAARRLREAEPLSASQAFWLVAATIVIERVLDSLAIVLILAVLVFMIPVPAGVEWGAGVLLAIDVVGVTLLVTMARAPHLGRRLVVRLTARWPQLGRTALAMFDTALRGLHGIRTPRHALRIVAWTVLVWILPVGAAWTMLRAVHLELPFIAGWVVLAFVGLGISVPSAPGYLGVWHFAAKLALEIFGVAPSAAVAYALIYHASAALPITLLGWLYLLREHVSLGEARRTPAPLEAMPKN
jgi:glycosyltransferase 2 family protein